jgi:hypothetical protein
MKKFFFASLISSSLFANPIVQPFADIKYVPMPPLPEKPLEMTLWMEGAENVQSALPGIGKNNSEMINRVSRGRIHMTYKTGLADSFPHTDKTHKKLRLVPGAASHVPIIGNGISGRHELGHEMGLGHASTCIWDTQTKIKHQSHEHDFTDPMTISPGTPSYNAPHIDLLKWFTPTEEAYAVDGGKYILRAINDENRDYKSLKALYYEVPNSNPVRGLWFSYVHVTGKGWDAPKGMPGTAIAIYERTGGATFMEGLIGLEPKTEIRSGLILTLSNPTPTQVTVDVKLDPTWVYQTGGDRCKP